MLRTIKISLLALALTVSLVSSVRADFPAADGDINEDHEVDLKDLKLLAGQWLEKVTSAEGLLAHWKLDGDANDSVGGNHGTVRGNPVWTAGQIDGALDLDGDGDYVDCGNDSSLNLTNNFSISVWFNSDNAGPVVLICKGNAPAYEPGGAYTILCIPSNGTLTFYVRDGSNAGFGYATVAIALNQWTHVVGTFSDGNITVYKNGSFVANDTLGTPTIHSNNEPFAIGAEGDGSTPFNGRVDDVRIYNRMLREAEVGAITNLSVPDPNCADLDYDGNVNMSDFALLAVNWREDWQTGSLQVTISPQEAIDAGAQWRVDGGTWRDSGYTEGDLSIGSHTVEYSEVTGWAKPGNETVQISDGQTTTTSGTYTQQTGSLQVTISPQAAIDAGARWRVDNNPWRDSGYTETGLSIGSHTVKYSTASGWTKPGNETVQIYGGQTTTTTGTYTAQSGSLQVTIYPQAAIDAGAQWRVDGGTWRNSSYIEGGLLVGSHTVEYSVVSGWNKPADEVVQINDAETTTTSGTYILQTGSLRVTISPQAAIDAGAQWRVDGGTWRNSGYTEGGLMIGSHTVEYSVVSGWAKPGNETVQIINGQTTTTSGTYTQQTGSLQVTISPQAAIDAGAQWRVAGGPWRNSGYTESGLAVGSHTVEYSVVSGWAKPGNETVQINYNQTTTTSGTYTQQTGSLQVTLSPQAAIDAGAQWQVDGGPWRNSGYTEGGLAVGSHTVEYNTVSGWNKPGDEVVQISDGQTTTTSGTYTLQTGSLQVTISPQAAIDAGAQWRVDGGTWRNSGYTESGLAVGSHTVEYSVVSGWAKPGNETVQINYNQTTTTSGTYTQQTGSLQVTLSPQGAIDAGAQWRVAGGPWRNSGYTESGLAVGSHTVEYNTVSGWNEPADEVVQINYNQTTTTGGTYVLQTGSLRVTISPQGAIDAGAQWRVAGGPWRNSGYTESGLVVGSHTVEYSVVSGWTKPGDEVVQINNGQTTTTSGTYILQTGSLQVTISPQGAIDAGAQWRVAGGTWRNSGYTESGLAVGSHTVEYNTVSGWNEPADEVVQINYNQTITTGGTYVQHTGSLQVTISPQVAIDAGAQWRVDGGTWRNSGYTESGLVVGSHTVEYNTVSGWTKPGDEVVQINDGQTTTTSGTYTQHTGSLQVTISPQGAIDAGAQWRVDGGTWRNSGYTESGLSIGSHTVEYSTVSGWTKPADEVVQISDGQTTTTGGTYIRQTGSLQVTISPQAAIDAGAQWRVDGGTWRDSGDTESDLWVGSHTVGFNDIDGWTKPGNQVVQIADGQTTTASGTYIEQTGALLVISEFMASNDSNLATTVDGQEIYPDWIEVYNPTDTNVSLDGWYLTDNNDRMTKWQFPDGLAVEPGEFLIVFASNKDYVDYPDNYPYLDDDGYYHTNFNLGKGGEYLALVSADGNTIAHEYTPEYPAQLTDVSYGLAQYAATLVPTGATASYYVPTSGDAGVNWTALDFNDSTWDTGATGLGFGAAVIETGQDIGIPSAAGSYSVANGVYTVVGDGEDIWGDTDDFYYVYTPLTGDGEMTARVVSIEYTNDWAKAGVMIRETLTDTSSHAMMIATPPEGTTDAFSFQWANGLDRNHDTTGGDVTLPAWVKIVRSGDTFTGYYAPDESGLPGTWVQQDSTTIEMVDEVYIGLCVTSHSDGVLCTAVFDNVERGGEISSDLRDKMLGINASMLARLEFDLEEGERDLFDTLMLRMKYEDGFVAYLNGEKVAERNAPGSLQWNSTALGDRPIEEAFVFETINLMAYLDTLQTGTNVLAIHGLNDNLADEEFLILPELVAASNINYPQYFTTATPGTFNVSGAEGVASDVWFSHKRGFYDASFELALYTEMDDADIYLTFDGSRPTIAPELAYAGPFIIDETTTVRAVAVRPGWLDSKVETHTYIFISDVITQSPNGEAPDPNWPAPGYFNGQLIDYGIDPDVVVYDFRYKDLIDDALLAIPTISLVTDLDNLFSISTGIYVNAGQEGLAWERPTSVELLYPPNPQGPGFPDLVEVPDGGGGTLWELPSEMRGGFQIDAGLRIRGGYSVSGNNPKHAFRLFFRGVYGDAKLNYPLFSDKGVDEFDHIDFRCSQNYSWAFSGDSANTMVREVFSRDLQGEMGHPYTRSRYYHLYINGHYWGLFQTQERSEASYGESYMGGNKDDYDVITSNWSAGRRMVPTDGNRDALDWLYDEAVALGGFSDYERYYRVQGLNVDGTVNPNYERLLDIDNVIDFMIVEYYTGDRDGPGSRFGGIPNNTWAICNRVNLDGFKWPHHDNEHTLGAGAAELNMVTPFTSSGAQREYFNQHWLHEQLMFSNGDYRMHFADHVYRHFFNDGLMTLNECQNRIINRRNQIDMAIIAESARWGDSKRHPPRTKDDDWLPELNRLLYESSDNRYLTPRVAVVLNQFSDVGWYPGVEAPTFNHLGGVVPSGFNVTMSSPSGTIWYTTDGNDPRLSVALSAPGSEITLVAENALKRFLVPTGPVAATTGSILREYWTGISGVAVSDLTLSPDFPGNPSGSNLLTSFEAPIDWADFYGTRVRGYLHPPTSGDYTFWIASDDASELWLSTDDDPCNVVKIAEVAGWCQSRDWDNLTGSDNPNQQSAPKSLTGGQKYYIEALQKEGSGGDNLAVAWQSTGITRDVIGGQYLSPVADIWATNYFDDSNWPSDTGGVGYERFPTDPVNYVGLFNIDVEGDMYGNNGTCYIRIPFTVSHTDLSDMTLKMRYDDGFVAYINGVEVARRNFVGAPVWDSIAIDQNPDSNAIHFEYVDISSHIGTLHQGDNILAIHGLNFGTTSSDFLISAELVATEMSQGDVSPSALQYIVPVTLNHSTHVKARVLDGTWSPLSEAVFAIGPVVDNLRITEMMYHPQDTGDPNNDPNAEFIELKNIGTETLNLNLVSFTEGIHFTFPSLELEDGEYVLVVKDQTVFASRYTGVPPAVDILGPYEGRLANGGERIRLEDAIGQTIHDFEYGDGWRPITDGDGFSLTIIEPTDPDPNSWGEKDSWRASDYVGGSPGDDTDILPNPGAVVINEVMAHSHLAPDWIELYNTTDTAINISGWFLSDNDANLMKYRIPDGTTIAGSGPTKYLVFYEDQDFNSPSDPGCIVPFAFSENGEEVCLSSAEGDVLTGYREVEDFGASETGVSFGRYFKSSTGNFNFVAMDHNTPGDDNADPKVGPVVISEIMYNPQSGNQNEEYIELYNITGSPVTLYRYDKGEPWKFTDGIDFTFPASPNEIAIPAYGYLLVVKNPTAFALRYGTPGVQVLGPYDGKLSNGGERVELSMPGDVDEYGRRYYIRIDRVNYSDGSHPEDCPGGVDLWPREADGGGKSLTRINLNSYGNDVINWSANDPSPGVINP